MNDVFVGTSIKRYRILECVHKSELIAFYRAYDPKLERNVSLKIVLHSANYSEESIAYFLSESKALAKLSHPNIARVLDFEYADGNLYLVSEDVSGKPLSDVLSSGPMKWQQAAEIILSIAEGLEYAHSKGVLHRDLKPSSIILDEDGSPILNDFSLLRIIEDEETKDLTGTHVGLGSPNYISPEQGQGLPADFRSDIYSMGTIFFEMITGEKLFSAPSSMELVIQHIAAPPPKPTKYVPDLPVSIERVILTALKKNIKDRYQSMGEFSQALMAAVNADIDSKPALIHWFRNNKMASIALLVLAVALGLYLIGTTVFGNPSGTVFGGQVQVTQDGTELIAATPLLQPSLTSTGLDTIPPTTEYQIPAPAENFDFPETPVLASFGIPHSSEGITENNVIRLTELARLGTPIISEMAFLNGDQYFLAATSAGIYIYEVSTLQPRYFFDTGGWQATFRVSEDGKNVITGDEKGNVSVWNLLNGEKIAWFNGHTNRVTTLDVSPDGSKIVSAALDHSVRAWSIGQAEMIFEIENVPSLINKLLFLPGGDVFITGGDDAKITIWNSDNGTVIKKITTSQRINDLAISSDGSLVAAALNNATVEIWNIAQGELVKKLSNHQILAPYTSVEFLPNNVLLLTGSADGVAGLWNIQGAELVWQAQSNISGDKNGAKAITVNRDGTKFLRLYEGGYLELWDIVQKQQVKSLEFNVGPIERVELSSNDHMIAYQTGNSQVDVFSTIEKRIVFNTMGSLPYGNPISVDSTKLAIENGDLMLYSLRSGGGEKIYTFEDPPKGGTVGFLAEDTILVSSKSDMIKYWSMGSGRELKTTLFRLEGNCRIINRQDGSFLAATSRNGILGFEENFQKFCAVPSGAGVTSVDFLQDGRVLSFTRRNKTIEVWNVLTMENVVIKSDSIGFVQDIAISKDGNLLAIASANGIIEIYDINTQVLLNTLRINTASIKQVVFSEDQKWIIFSIDDGTIRIWGLYP